MEVIAPDTPLEDRTSGRLETCRTDDGLTLRMKRYLNEGGRPVLLVPGFTGNGMEFDLPLKGRSLARWLAERGYDVWMASFRGCGREPFRCDAGDWSHSIDHLAALDLPAMVRAVNDATGRPPVCLGHSMGGTVIYWYLLGARLEPAPGGGGEPRVVLDGRLREERHHSVLGGVTVCSPAGRHYPNFSWLHHLTRLPFSPAVARTLTRGLRWLSPRRPRIPISGGAPFFARHPRLSRFIAKWSPLTYFLGSRRHLDPEITYNLLKYATDDVTTRMFCQIVSLGFDPDYRDYRGELDYTAHMHLLRAPLFFITGTRDFVGTENLRHAHDLVASEPKRFNCYQGYGHTGLVMGKGVAETVFPDILAWLEELEGIQR